MLLKWITFDKWVKPVTEGSMGREVSIISLLLFLSSLLMLLVVVVIAMVIRLRWTRRADHAHSRGSIGVAGVGSGFVAPLPASKFLPAGVAGTAVALSRPSLVSGGLGKHSSRPGRF